MTTRCNVPERRAFREHASAWNNEAKSRSGRSRMFGNPALWIPSEPALGTLKERLDILSVRHGVRLRPGKPTDEELATVTR